MLLDKSITNGESKPDTLYAVLFGCKKGLENFSEMLLFYAGPGIRNHDVNPFFFNTGGYIQIPPVRHGIHGIGNQVQKNLPQFVLGSLDLAWNLGERRGELYAVFPELLVIQQNDLFNHRIDINRNLFVLLRIGKRQHLA